MSSAVMETFRRVTPLVEVLSLDEAFLHVGGATRRLGSPLAIAERLRATIHDEQRIGCSVGLAATKSLAKMASRRAKPDGVLVVPPEDVTAFLHPLDVGELWGVGERTQEVLHRFGLVTVGDIAHTPRRPSGARWATTWPTICTIWPGASTTGRWCHHGPDEPEPRWALTRPSGATPTTAPTSPASCCGSARVTGRMRVAGVAGRTVTLRVRFADFTTITRSRTLPEATDVTQEIYRTAVRLYDALGLQRTRIRLVGVRVEGLQPRNPGAPAAGAGGGAGARLARRRSRGRPRDAPLRERRGPAGVPARPALSDRHWPTSPGRPAPADQPPADRPRPKASP
ncbi:MAG: DNA polymerase IV [Nocardioides sp.]